MPTQKIIVRTPNWLGDLVMSHAFFKQLKLTFPNAEIHAIVKQSLADLMPLFTEVDKIYVFNKNEFKGLLGLKKFAKSINQQYQYFFCLPDSFSSAFMGWFLKADNKIGFKNEMRSFMLTQSFSTPQNTHRVEKYINLLELSGFKTHIPISTTFNTNSEISQFINPNHLSVTFNPLSVGLGRSFSVEQSRQIVSAILQNSNAHIYVIGTNEANNHAIQITNIFGNEKITNLTGKTSLFELAQVLQTTNMLVTTDSGPAHLANAFNKPVMVFFSSGKPTETSPYHKEKLQLLQYNDILNTPKTAQAFKTLLGFL